MFLVANDVKIFNKYREQIESKALEQGRIENDLTTEELTKLGQVVRENNRNSGHLSVVQSLFFYYFGNRKVFKDFERLINLPAIKEKQPIKKISTFRGD
jgi:hypothetical protein